MSGVRLSDVENTGHLTSPSRLTVRDIKWLAKQMYETVNPLAQALDHQGLNLSPELLKAAELGQLDKSGRRDFSEQCFGDITSLITTIIKSPEHEALKGNSKCPIERLARLLPAGHWNTLVSECSDESVKSYHSTKEKFPYFDCKDQKIIGIAGGKIISILKESLNSCDEVSKEIAEEFDSPTCQNFLDGLKAVWEDNFRYIIEVIDNVFDDVSKEDLFSNFSEKELFTSLFCEDSEDDTISEIVAQFYDKKITAEIIQGWEDQFSLIAGNCYKEPDFYDVIDEIHHNCSKNKFKPKSEPGLPEGYPIPIITMAPETLLSGEIVCRPA